MVCVILQFTMFILWTDIQRQDSIKGTHEEKTAQEDQPQKQEIWQVLRHQLSSGCSFVSCQSN